MIEVSDVDAWDKSPIMLHKINNGISNHRQHVARPPVIPHVHHLQFFRRVTSHNVARDIPHWKPFHVTLLHLLLEDRLCLILPNSVLNYKSSEVFIIVITPNDANILHSLNVRESNTWTPLCLVFYRNPLNVRAKDKCITQERLIEDTPRKYKRELIIFKDRTKKFLYLLNSRQLKLIILISRRNINVRWFIRKERLIVDNRSSTIVVHPHRRAIVFDV